MPGQRFGYPVGSHYTGVRGVRDYLRHIRSTYHTSSGWRVAAKKYASRLGKFALRGSGYIAAAAAFAEGAGLVYRMYTDRRSGGRSHKRSRPYSDHSSDAYGYRAAAGTHIRFPDEGTKQNMKYPRNAGSAGANPSVMTMAKLNTGRRKTFRDKVSSLVASSLVPYVDRYGALTNTYDAAASYPLAYRTLDAGVTYRYPVYLYELNTHPSPSGSTTGAPMMQLQRTVANGNYAFTPQGSSDPDATTSRFIPNVEYQADNSVATLAVVHKVFLDWVDIRVTALGPRKSPSVFTMKLVQFIDEDLQPDCFSCPTATPGTAPTVVNGRSQPSGGDNLIEWNAYWQRMLANLLGNPLNRRNIPGKEIMRVLKTYRCTFQPRSTTDDSITGGTGDTKNIKWFNRVGKTYTYAVSTNPTAVTAVEEIDPQEQNGLLSAVGDTHARPKARLFVLFEAFTPVAADGTTDRTVADVACQFDVVVRRKFYFTDRS